MSRLWFRARLVPVLVVLTMWAPAAWAQTPATLDRARALYDAGSVDEARVMLEGLVRTQTSDPGVYLLLGVIQRATGHLPEAIASFERAHALDTASAHAAVELATTLAWRGDLDRAVQLFQQVLDKQPAQAGARVGLAFALAWQGHLERALAIFDDLIAADPRNVDAWTGRGFVERASLRRATAEAAYRRVLELDPKNKDATAALSDLHWDRRTDVRVFGGGSVVPDGTWEAETRMDVAYALSSRLTIGGAYQHYAFGAVLPIGGVEPASGTRSEDSIEANALWRPSRRLTIGNNIYTFFNDDTKRGVLWEEAVFAVTPRISLIGVFRPAFSSSDPTWLMAGAAGTTVALTPANRVTVKALIAADTTYEPRLTWMVDYGATFSRRFETQISVANSTSDDQFAFTSVAVTARWLMTPSVGLSIIANHRTQTFERSEILIGVIVRR